MTRNSIGLDIGTRAVRLAEVHTSSSGPVVTRFGRVLLPVGAVEHGEIQDPAAVATAITTLWKRLGLTGKAVHVGMSNRRVVVRVIELPAMSREDLAGAIRFSAQEHIPIPLAEAVMDFEILEEIAGPNGDTLQRVLVVAAERSTIAPLLAALQAAHVEPATLELNAYPLVRCFGNGSGGAEAIIDMGAGVTNVVVQQGGKIRFTRILPTFGGDEFTMAVAQRLGISRDEAETLKRQASSVLKDRALHPAPAMAQQRKSQVGATRVISRAIAEVPADEPGSEGTSVEGPTAEQAGEVAPPHDPPAFEEPEGFSFGPTGASQVEQAADVIEPMVERFVTEVRGSLDFYSGQVNSLAIERIVLTGGGALMGGIAEQLNAALGASVEQGHPFDRVQVGDLEVSPEEQAVAEPFVGVAFGLALAGTGA